VNYHLFELLNRAAGRVDSLDDVMEFLAARLIYPVFAVATALVVVSLYRRRLRPVLRFGTTLTVAFVLATLLAQMSREVRPFQTHQVHQLVSHGPGVSMPSDHATAAFAVAFGVALFLHRDWGIVLMVAALAIGIARIWVGVHYPGDIIAGAVVAGLAALEVYVWTRWRHGPARSGYDLSRMRGLW
jgi:undecaprenyl-diphosphatase